MSAADKRRSRRKLSEEVVEFYDVDGSLLKGVGRVLNVSTVGALVESTLRLEPRQRLWVRIRRKNRPALELPVSVVRLRGKGATLTYGLEFIPRRKT